MLLIYNQKQKNCFDIKKIRVICTFLKLSLEQLMQPIYVHYHPITLKTQIQEIEDKMKIFTFLQQKFPLNEGLCKQKIIYWLQEDQKIANIIIKDSYSQQLLHNVEKIIKQLQCQLQNCQYIIGSQITTADLNLFLTISEMPQTFKEPINNIKRWYTNLAQFHPYLTSKTIKKISANSQNQKQISEQSLFDSDSDSENANKNDKIEFKDKEPIFTYEPKLKKKYPVCIQAYLQIIPFSQEQNMQQLYQKIKSLQIKGVTWDDHPRIVSVGFRKNKLIIRCTSQLSADIQKIDEIILEKLQVMGVQMLHQQKCRSGINLIKK